MGAQGWLVEHAPSYAEEGGVVWVWLRNKKMGGADIQSKFSAVIFMSYNSHDEKHDKNTGARPCCADCTALHNLVTNCKTIDYLKE